MRGAGAMALHKVLHHTYLLASLLVFLLGQLINSFSTIILYSKVQLTNAHPSGYSFALDLTMADSKSVPQSRLGQVKDLLTMNKIASTIPFDPDSTQFPRRKDVPQPSYAPPGVRTAWVWGENDNVSIAWTPSFNCSL